MAKITITEGLAEIKTLNARIVKKRESAARYLARDARLRDPLEADGGSVEFIKRERQAVHDLEERIVGIRCAIQAANQANSLEVGETRRSIAGWLNWRREISQGARGFLSGLTNGLNQVRQQALKQGLNVTATETGNAGDIVVAINERQLAKEVEQMEQVLGELDGKLSLLNATTMIEV